MILGRRVNHRRGLLLSVVLILVVSDGAQATPPLETETARLLKQGQLETDAAAEYQSSSEGSEVAIPLEFEYGITDWLSLLVEPVVLTSILPKHGSSTTGVGDLEITTFGHLVNEREYVPAIAIAGEVKVPTTQNNLIGTGELDVTPFLIASKRFGRFDTHVNLGYGILGNPPGVKLDNIITYAAAVEFFLDEHWDLVAEVIGNTSSSPKVKGSAPKSPLPPASPPPDGESPDSVSGGSLGSLRVAAETPDQGSGGASSVIPGEPSVIPEAAGAEVSGLIGVRYHFTPRFNVSLGVTYDNQNAVLVRPGLTFVFLTVLDGPREVFQMRKMLLVRCLLGISLLPASPQGAEAKEQRVTMDSLPAAVRKTATEQSKGATTRGISTETEHGKTLYEVELTVNGHTRDVLIAADGSVSEVEEETAVASLPAPVKVTLEQEAAPGKIVKVEAVTKGGKLAFYEALVQEHGKKTEVSVGPDGKLMPKEKD